MEQRPLSLPEFIGPLSLCANTMDDQYDEFKVSAYLKNETFRNSRMTFREMANVELKSKPLFAEKMAARTLRRKRKRRRASDFKN